MKTKTIALLLAVALVFGGVIGGTIAWLTDITGKVTNTFTTAGIDIDLTETYNTDKNNDGTKDAWEAQLIPGKEYEKNPVVKVIRPATDVDIYLFVKFEETNNPSTYLTYTSTLTEDNGWYPVAGETNVWYRTVGATDETIEWHLLEGDKVTVKSELTAMPVDLPELTFTAYACQKDNLTVAQAWAEVKP